MGTLRISSRSTDPDSLAAHSPPGVITHENLTFAQATAQVAAFAVESYNDEYAGQTIMKWAVETGERRKLTATYGDWEDTYEWSL